MPIFTGCVYFRDTGHGRTSRTGSGAYVGYRVGQGLVSRNASRNTCGRVQGEVLLVPLISCSNEDTSASAACAKSYCSEILSIAGWNRSSTGSIISRLQMIYLYDLGTHLHIVYTFKQYIVICAALPRRGINNFAMIRRI